MDLTSIFFNGCAFILATFLLHYSSDILTNNAEIILRRLEIPSILACIFTSGAEWQGLAITLASIQLHEPAIGYSNIIGSSIANPIGALAIYLLSGPPRTKFDKNAKVHAKLLLVFSSIFAVIALNNLLDLSGGIFLLVAFSVYVFSIVSAIYDEILTISTDGGEQEQDGGEEARTRVVNEDRSPRLQITIFSSVAQADPAETSSLLPAIIPSRRFPYPLEEDTTRTTVYHLLALLLGCGLLYISAIVLVQTTSSLASALNFSPQTLGLTLLCFATTIPEKIISAVLHLSRHPNTVIANISTTTVFLLTLCIGVLFCSTGTAAGKGARNGGGDMGTGEEGDLARVILPIEIWTVWGCSLFMNIVVWTGGWRWTGALMLVCYGAMIGAELTVLRR